MKNAIAERLAADISDEEYEAKIAGLIRRSFAADCARDSQAKETWRHAFSVLDQGDHYILIMIGEALGRAFKPGWRFW